VSGTPGPGLHASVDGGRTAAGPGPRSRLDATIRSGRFAVTAEITPPRGVDAEVLRRKARALKGWVDAVNLTDNPSAYVRMASWAASTMVLAEGVEPVFQLQCRDRNRIALQSDLIGASAVGIPNVLLLTGDHVRFGDHPEAKGVFDLDSVQLVWLASTLRDKGSTVSGHPLASAPKWFIGAVENPSAPPTAFRARRLAKKVAAGADFVQTQFVFDLATFEAWMAEVVDLGLAERCAVLAGVGPIRSLRGLEHMRREIPGIVVPDEVAKRLESQPRGRVEAEGVDICVETISHLRTVPGVAGVHVMAYGFEESVPEILARSGLGRRPEPLPLQSSEPC
jgi:methylenetetrahydrofolate reductase (NADPH)